MFGGLIKSKLYPHQKDNLRFHLSQKRTADFSEMGTGKTAVALGKIAHLVAKGEITKTLIICPRSVIPVWANQIETHSYLSYTILEGSLFNKGKLLTARQNEDIYIVSYDSIPGRKSTKDILLKILLMFKFDMVVLDEVTFIKNYKTYRFQAVRMLCDVAKHVLFLTGTPITNRPDTIFTIYLALDKGETFGRNFFRARNKYFKNVGIVFPIWQVKETMKDELTQRIYTKAVRVRKEDCLSLPEKVFLPRYCELTEKQKILYKPIAEEIIKSLKIGEAKINIPNTLAKMSKLSQICSGFVYATDGKVVPVESGKQELLREVLEEIGEEKVIIYTRWKEDIQIISHILDASKRRYVIIEGSTMDRKTPVDLFQNDPDIKVLIAQITTGGYALTLTASHYIIYYSLTFALTDWLQSQDRIHRMGQNKTCFYIPLLTKNSIDEYIYESLERKIDVAKAIIDVKRLEKYL